VAVHDSPAGFFLPAIILLPRLMGLNGIWAAFSLSEMLSAILAGYFLLRLWKTCRREKDIPL
jgi:Na+-driven multidrug efflux pump